MGKLRPKDQVKLAALADLSRSAQTLHGLTEQFAAARSGEGQFAHSIKRRSSRFKRALMLAGFDQIAQLAGAMEMAAGKSSSQRAKTRILRECMGSIKFQLDAEERIIRASAKDDEGDTPK